MMSHGGIDTSELREEETGIIPNYKSQTHLQLFLHYVLSILINKNDT